MSALTQDRDTPRRDALDFEDPVASGKTIYAGALVVLNASGFAEPAKKAQNLVLRGVAQGGADNSGGSDGDRKVWTRAGCFRFDNDSGDPVTRANIGELAWIVDDHTVASADTGTPGRTQAGVIKDLDGDGVWVQIG